MAAYVSRPAVVFPDYQVTLDELVADIRRAHPDHPRLIGITRVVGRTGVRLRRFTQPLETVAATEPILERNARAYADLCLMGVQAARSALDDNGLDPLEVDAVVTSHSTGMAIPGLDVHLINELGLKPTVRRIPITQMGCAGGAYALVRAADHLRAHPGSTVLLVVAETLSSVYQHTDDSIESMIYKVLFGDSAGAVVVSDRPGRGYLRIDDTWEYTIPDSTERYRLRVDGDGQHFESTAQALESVDELMPPLLDWYRRSDRDDPEFVIAHTGGPRILTDLEKGLGCDPKLLRHSWASLRERGNLGGNAVLDVFARHLDDAPSPGATGLLIGVGPGFTAAACRATWSVD